ncbi:MAG TPA: glycosyltransferase [Verrucomicrobiae bacterium]|nr:glycosyltransferase [Verrucomicrobiae bacterium]
MPELPMNATAALPLSASRPLSVFISLNGSLAQEGKSVGGGDLVLFKFIRLAEIRPDVLIPESATSFVPNAAKKFLTRRNNQLSLPGIITLFLTRIVQGVLWAFRNRTVYDVALSASPFSVDVIPIWFWKARRKGAVIYHINPARKAVNLTTRVRFAIAACEQALTLLILRRACDFIVAGNEYVRGQLAERLPGKPMFILPAGFDAHLIDSVRAEARDPDLACFVGRLVSQKGIFDLLHVMKSLSRSRPGLRLIMAGTGPEGEFLATEMKRLEVTNIELAGFVTEEEKIALLKRSQFFFFPSYEEGWGIALAEALYCGCRCFCYELPHYRSIFSEYPIYVKPGDHAAFAQAVESAGPVSETQKTFMRQYDDPEVANTLAEHLRTVAHSR